MAFRSSLRPLILAARSSISATRAFHASRPAFVKVGDSIPSLELTEGSPGNKVNLATEFSAGNGIVIGVPGAFSPGCSQKHIPSYLMHPGLKGAGKVFVVAVNDPFVMKAWGDVLDSEGVSGIRFLADSTGEFTKALELDFDATKVFGNHRSKRYALVVQDGKVKTTHIESDGTGTNDSMADKVLGPLRLWTGMLESQSKALDLDTPYNVVSKQFDTRSLFMSLGYIKVVATSRKFCGLSRQIDNATKDFPGSPEGIPP